MSAITQLQLKSLLSYNPETGIFVWLVGKRARKAAGSKHKTGYFNIRIKGKIYYAHRLAWLYINGEFPSADLDHINCVKTDNRFENLRECLKTQNLWNVGIIRSNKSGFKGVSWHKKTEKWRASIKISGKSHYLGCFATPELAAEAYKTKAKAAHGDFYCEV